MSWCSNSIASPSCPDTPEHFSYRFSALCYAGTWRCWTPGCDVLWGWPCTLDPRKTNTDPERMNRRSSTFSPLFGGVGGRRVISGSSSSWNTSIGRYLDTGIDAALFFFLPWLYFGTRRGTRSSLGAVPVFCWWRFNLKPLSSSMFRCDWWFLEDRNSKRETPDKGVQGRFEGVPISKQCNSLRELQHYTVGRLFTMSSREYKGTYASRYISTIKFKQNQLLVLFAEDEGDITLTRAM